MQIRQTYIEWIQSNQIEQWYCQYIMIYHGFIMMLLGVSLNWIFFTMGFIGYLSVVPSVPHRNLLILLVMFIQSESLTMLSPWIVIATIRFFLLTPVPWAIQGIIEKYRPLPVFETAVVRAWQRLTVPYNFHVYRSIYHQIIQGVYQQDQSEPLSDYWRERIRHNLTQICNWVILRDHEGTLIIMPSVIIIIKQRLFVILPVQMDVVEAFGNEDEVCPICQDKFSRFVAKLNCGHQYCPRCILQWTYTQKTCPLCRAKINSSQILPGTIPTSLNEPIEPIDPNSVNDLNQMTDFDQPD